jgi:hypothetical protein
MNLLERTIMTLSCRDTDRIAKVPNAGNLAHIRGRKVQIMHNGLAVVYGGYYGDWMAHVIRGLQGHHEPQEELIFHTLLRYVRQRTLMVELGSYWSYYTLWFLQQIPESTALCIEPDAAHLAVGKRNANINRLHRRVRFVQGWLGGAFKARHEERTEESKCNVVLPVFDYGAVETLCKTMPIELLHMDIQGFEMPFLESMTVDSAAPRVRFVVISTHHHSISGSYSTHDDCLHRLRNMGATILVEHSVAESFSGDGLIAASFFREDRDLVFPAISKNEAAKSLFGTS